MNTRTITTDYMLSQLAQVSQTVTELMSKLERLNKPKTTRRETIAHIIERVGSELNISPEAMASKSRATEISTARHLANYIAYKAGHRLAVIDRTCNRPNGCARNAVNKIEDMISINDPETLDTLKRLGVEINQGKE